jgi:alkaline phosphatase D
MARYLPLLALLAVLVAPVSAPAAGFRYGVTAGEVTHKSAVLWTRADKDGAYSLEVARKPNFRDLVEQEDVRARGRRDNTIVQRVGGLKPDKTYFYRFVGKGQQSDQASDTGRFRTAPKRNSNATVEFGLSGDADGVRTLEGDPFYNRFEVYGRMARQGNDFNVNLGDTIYTDSEVVGVPIPPGDSVAAKRAKYQLNLGYRNLQRFRRATGVYFHWDDHEFINDFSRPEHGAGVYNAGVKAFREYNPITYSKARGIYRTFRWGRNVELFFLDERSFRDGKASAGGTCDNPETGEPDLAPTAPQRLRDRFALLVPSLAQPVAQECLDMIRDEDRDFIGDAQYRRFTEAIQSSKATWKIIVNEMPIQTYYALPYDNWSGYEAERLRLLRFLRDNVRNAVFLTTDVHANMVNDARLATFPEEDPAAPVNSGILDITTGPVATRTFDRQINDNAGNPNAGEAVRLAFLKTPPPDGVGMQCAAIDVYSYMQVRATANKLTVRLLDDRNRNVAEAPGERCARIELQRR